MENIENLKKSLKEERPNKWDGIPDIELYMDQVISFMPRQHIGLEGGSETLTSAMINNYVKKGLLPRANGKKYGRDHLAYLTAICLFKQVLSVSATDDLLKLEMEDQTIKSFYEKYCDKLDVALSAVSDQLNGEMDRQKTAELILDLAVSSYAQKLVCERLLSML